MTFHTAENLEKSIDFCDEHINSKVILKNEDSLSLLVAIKKNQLMPEHISPVDAFIYVLEGEVEFILTDCEESRFEVKKGEFFVFRANEKHAVFGKKDSKMLVVRI